ncbi:unnamed protein product [Cunninghamella echinulata]
MLISSILLLLPAVAYGNLILNYGGEETHNAQNRLAYQEGGFNNLVLYWGQGNNEEKPLSYYCQQPGVSIIVLGFIHDYVSGQSGTPRINLSDNCKNEEDCPEVSKDIQFCQSKGIKVIISMGGAAGPYHEQEWNSLKLATFIWNKFLGGRDESISRPFGNIVLDGVDFDPEGTNGKGYDKLVHQLRQLYKTNPRKKFLITAAPQCPNLDYYKNNAMYNLLHPSPDYDAYPDLVFVQFYNNYCSASKYTSQSNKQADFNFEQWHAWAEKNTKDTQIYLGLLGKNNKGDTGFIPFERLTGLLDDIHGKKRFGGVMIWDATLAYSNLVNNKDPYGNEIVKYLSELKKTKTLQLDDATPLLVPVLPGDEPINRLFVCENGQPFVLLNSVSVNHLMKYFSLPKQQPYSLFQSRFDVDNMDAKLSRGSYLCLGALNNNNNNEQRHATPYGLNFISNRTASMFYD